MAYRRNKTATSDEFFGMTSKDGDYTKLAEKVYVMMHTFYLNEGKKIKPEMGKVWDQDFGTYLTDEMFEYMVQSEPVLLRDVIIKESREGKEINSNKYLEKTLVALEFDLWMIERYKEGKALELQIFDAYMKAKYGEFIQARYRTFVKFDLMYLKTYENIAKQLCNHEDGIRKIFDQISLNNKAKISIDDPNADRLSDFGVVIREKKTTENIIIHKPVQTTTPKVEEAPRSPIPQPIAPQVQQTNNNREIQIIMREKDERIEKLEQDIKEFKRQRDEAREYSVNQYDRGVKNLFGALNDVRYGKVIDYLYSLLQDESTDERLASYLDNLFMALEDMEIEPIADQGMFVVKEETMVKDYNLDFDRTEYDKSKTKLKYYGWKYKDVPMEKPTLTKED